MDVNHSRWDCTLEAGRGGRLAVRLGLRLARGLANQEGALVPLARGAGPFTSVEEVLAPGRLSTGALERLADADAFGSLGLTGARRCG